MAFHGWRFEDKGSQVSYRNTGIYSGSRDDVTFRYSTPTEECHLRNVLRAHLKWHNHRKTPFISVFGSEDRALKEARRRVKTGVSSVVIHETRVDEGRAGAGLQWAHVPQLVRDLKIWLLRRVSPMAAEEYVFVHGIPWDCIERTDKLN